MIPSTHRYLASRKPLFGILVPWKWNSSGVMINLVEENKDSGGQLFIILSAWKCDPCRVV
jgi:hypothetical protein